MSWVFTLSIWNRLHDGGNWAKPSANLIPMPHNDIQTHVQQARDHVKWTLNA